MPDPTTPPADEDRPQRPETPMTPSPAPETEHVEEEGDPLGANFA
ncbi:hypothetical protein [Sphingomonas lenta]|nr:hypothetical protein [Sphingomonas lenta]